MSYNAGDVEARLVLDRTDFITGLRLARQQAESFERDYTATLKLDGETKTATQITAMQKKLTALASKTYKPKVKIDDAGSLPKITELQTRLTKLASKTYNVKIRVDAVGTSPAITKLQTQINKLTNKSVKIDVDIEEAYMEIMRLNATLERVTRDRTINIKTHADTKTAFKNLGALSMYADEVGRKRPTIVANARTASAEKSLWNLSKATDSADKGMSRYTKRILLLGAAIAVAIAPGIGVLATLLATLPTVAFIAGAAIGAVALGMEGIKKAAQTLTPEVDKLKAALNATFQAGLTKQFKELIPLFPIIQTGLVGQAKSLMQLSGAFVTTVTSAQGMNQIGQILGNVNVFMGSLVPTITAGTQAFLTLGVIGSRNLGFLSSAINGAMIQFNNMLNAMAATGVVDIAFQQLAGTVGALLTILNTLVISGLRFMAEVGGPLNTGLYALNGAFTALVPILISISNLFLAVLTPALNTLGQIANAVSPQFSALATSLGATLGTIIVQATPALIMLATHLMTVAGYVINFAAALTNFLGPALGPIAYGIAAIYLAMKTWALISTIVGGVTAAFQFLAAAIGFTAAETKAGAAGAAIYGAVMKAWQVVTAAATIVQWGLNAALLANPVGIVVAAVLLLIAALIALGYGIYKLIQNWDTVSAALSTGWQWLVNLFYSIWTPIASWFENLWQGIVDFFVGIWNGIPGFFSSLWDNIVSGLGNAASAVGKFLKDLPKNIAYALGYALGTIVRWSIDAFNAIVDWVPKALWQIGNFFANTLPNTIESAMKAAGTWLLQAGTDIINGLVTGVTTAFWAVVGFFQNLPTNIKNFFVNAYTWLTTDGVNLITGFWNGLVQFWTNVDAWFAALPANIGTFFANAATWLWAAGGDILHGLINGLVSGAKAVYDFFAMLVNTFMQGFRDALGINSPSTVFAQFGMDILNGLVMGLQAIWGAVVAFFAGAAAWLSGVFTGAWVAIQNIAVATWTFIYNFLVASVNGFLGFWSGIWTAISGFFGSVWAGIQSIAITVWNFIVGFFAAGLNNFINNWTAIWNMVSSFFGGVWTWIQNTAVGIWNFIAGFFQAQLNGYFAFWSMVWNNVSAFFGAIWTGIQNFAVAVWNAISNFFITAINAFVAFWTMVWNNILAFFTMIWVGIQAQAILLWTLISNFFMAGLNAFLSFWSMIWNAILTFFSNIWNGIVNLGTTLWNNLSSFFMNAINAFSGWWSNIWGAIRDSFGAAFHGIIDIATNIWNAVKGIFVTGINAVINGVNWPIDKINGLFSISIPRLPNVPALASGGSVQEAGPVRGKGGPRTDSVLTRLSNREHVWSAREVAGMGGHKGVEQLRAAALKNAKGLATGGRVLGSEISNPVGGMVTSNSIPSITPGSFVVGPQVASFSGNFLNALNQGQAEAVLAAGGKKAPKIKVDHHAAHNMGNLAKLPGFADGGNIPKMPIPKLADGGPAVDAGLKFAASMNGKPYIWGGVGPAGMDCSGYMSAITNVLRGQGPYHRIGVARSQPWPGFVPGLSSAFATGFNQTHTAGTLGGTNVESSKTPIVFPGAHGANDGQFSGHASLPQVGGQFVPGAGGGGGLDIMGLLTPIKAAAEAFIRTSLTPLPPPFLKDVGVGTFDKSWDGMVQKAISMMGALFGGGGPIAGGAAPPGVINGWIMAALAALGYPQNYAGGIYQQIMTESGGNPNAVQGNIGDINNRTGNLARGIMQVIPPTFAANMLPGHGNIMNPVDNIIAGSRYAMKKYGAGWFNPGPQHSHGYDTGGVLPKGVSLVHNATNQNEHMGVYNDDQWQTLLKTANNARDIERFLADNNTGSNAVDETTIKALASQIANGGNTTNITAQLPQGTTIKQLVQELMFQLRHSGKGVFD